MSAKAQPQGVIVPYSSDQIKVEKHGGKRTAAIFCGSKSSAVAGDNSKRRSDQHGRKVSSPRQHKAVTTSSAGESVNISSATLNIESDVSDAFSMVSDVSDLSCMSLPPQPSSLVSSTGSCRSGIVLPLVHGRGGAEEDVSVGRRRTKRPSSSSRSASSAFPWWRPERRSFTETIMSTRTDLVRLQEENFALRRENVNLKSQMEALQRHRLSAPVTLVVENSAAKVIDDFVGSHVEEPSKRTARWLERLRKKLCVYVN